jgi:hypothetical protein
MKAALALAALIIAAPAQAAFNPVDFFRGHTHGTGTLKVIFSASKRIQVDSLGVQEKDGSLVLKQIIHEPGKDARTRYWRLRQTRPNRFQGTLTDAAGPVLVEQTGNNLRIRYTAPNHLNFDQTLEPVSATEVRNHMRVKRFGIIVARFEEVIRKAD